MQQIKKIITRVKKGIHVVFFVTPLLRHQQVLKQPQLNLADVIVDPYILPALVGTFMLGAGSVAACFTHYALFAKSPIAQVLQDGNISTRTLNYTPSFAGVEGFTGKDADNVIRVGSPILEKLAFNPQVILTSEQADLAAFTALANNRGKAIVFGTYSGFTLGAATFLYLGGLTLSAQIAATRRYQGKQQAAIAR